MTYEQSVDYFIVNNFEPPPPSPITELNRLTDKDDPNYNLVIFRINR